MAVTKVNLKGRNWSQARYIGHRLRRLGYRRLWVMAQDKDSDYPRVSFWTHTARTTRVMIEWSRYDTEIFNGGHSTRNFKTKELLVLL